MKNGYYVLDRGHNYVTKEWVEELYAEYGDSFFDDIRFETLEEAVECYVGFMNCGRFDDSDYELFQFCDGQWRTFYPKLIPDEHGKLKFDESSTISVENKLKTMKEICERAERLHAEGREERNRVVDSLLVDDKPNS